ncbi:MAG: M56 family metallopeptidase [Gemmatimonadaceae bacterium]
MIVSWILFALLTGGLLTVAGAAIDRLAALSGRPRRFVWLTTLILTAFWPVFSLISLTLPRSTLAPSQFAAVHRLSALVVAPSGWEIPSRWMLALVLVWLLCSALLFTRLWRALAYARRGRSSWQTLEIDGMRVQVARDIGPAVVGLRKMTIVLPEWAIEVDPALRSLILRHEAEHRRTRDPWLLLTAAVITALIPWNILLWFQARRLRLVIEIDCDRRVLRTHTSWREYARLLLTIAQQRSGASGRLVPALLEPTSNLERRITAMRTASTLSRLNAFCLTLVCCASVAVACAVDKPEAPSRVESSQRVAGPTGALAGPQIKQPNTTYFEFQVEKPATPSAGQEMKYPRELRAAGVSGTVVAQYVVDATGRVEISSFKVLKADDPRLVAPVKAALTTWQFDPASVGGHKVRQLVQQEFDFGT